MNDSWESGVAYEKFMGRWSHLVAQQFLAWLNMPLHPRWLDVGCGSGTLSKIIAADYQPEQVVALDSPPNFIAYPRRSLTHPAVMYSTKPVMTQSNNFKPSTLRNHKRDLDKTQFPRTGDGLAAGGSIELAEDVRDVALDRGQTDHQRFGDVFVAGSGGHELQDLKFTRGERRELIRPFGRFL